MEIFVATVEDEVISIVLLLVFLLFGFDFRQYIFQTFIQFRWRLAKWSSKTDYVLQVSMLADLVLDEIGCQTADGMSDDREPLIFIISVFQHGLD